MRGFRQGALVEYRVVEGTPRGSPGIVIKSGAPDNWGGTDFVQVQFMNKPDPKWVSVDNLRALVK
jgi:hypothetical protein